MKCKDHPDAEILETGFRKVFESQRYKCSKCHKEVEKNFVGFSFILFLIALITLSSFVLADPTSNFVSPTPSNGSTVSQRNFIINATIDSNVSIDSIIYTYNGTNFNVLDPLCAFGMNFDNRTALGENSSYVIDICKGNNGTIMGSGVSMNQSSRYGGAIYSDGTTGFLNTTNTLNSSFNGQALTISFWIKVRNDTNFHEIWDTGNMRLETTPSNGKVSITMSNQSTSVNSNPAAFYSVASGTESGWSQLVMVYNGTTLSFYLNGTVLQEFTTLTGNLNGTTSTFKLLGNGATSANVTIDDFFIFNKALNSSQVLKLYNTEITKFNNTRYIFFANESNLTVFNTNYNLFANLTSGISNTSSLTTRFLSSLTLGTTSKGTYDNCYGVNIPVQYVGNVAWASNNLTYNRNKILEGKFNCIRVNVNLNTFGVNSTGYLGSQNVTGYADMIDWARNNSIKVIIPFYRTPSWLANTTAISGVTSCTSDNATCPPVNFDTWSQAVISIYNNISCDASTCIAEIWNEPDLAPFWFADLGVDQLNATRRSQFYNQLYNSSYTLIKAYNPNIKVIGGVWASDGTRGNTLMQGFISNITSCSDGIATHRYLETTDGDSTFDRVWGIRINSTFGNSTLYGKNCNLIYIDEFNIYNQSLMENSAYNNLFGMSISSAYAFGLNNYNKNISFVIYQWTSDYFKLVNITDNTVYPSFNVTMNYAKYAAVGSELFSTTNDNSEFTQVYSTILGFTSLTLTNKVPFKQNITLNCGSFTGNLIDTQNGNLFSCGSGSVNLGVIDAYDVRYYTEPDYEEVGGEWMAFNYLGEYISTLTDEQLAELGLTNSHQGIGSTCDDTTLNFYAIILNLSSLALIGYVFYWGTKDGMFEMNLQKIFIMGIGLIVGIILFQISADNLAIGACG